MNSDDAALNRTAAAAQNPPRHSLIHRLLSTLVGRGRDSSGPSVDSLRTPGILSDALPLSAAEWETLYATAVSSMAMTRHDLRGVFSAVLHGAQMLTNEFDGSADERSFSDAQLLHIAQVIRRGVERAERIVENSVPRYPGLEKEHPFMAPVDEIIDALLMLFPDAKAHLEPADPAALRLLYPRVSLFGVIHELVANSVKHAATQPEVSISWALKGQRFCLSIEDNGPGISPSLSSSNLDLESVRRRTDHQRTGLDAVHCIIAASRGLLLFRRSERMGGTQALVEFPVIGAWRGDRYQHFGARHEP